MSKLDPRLTVRGPHHDDLAPDAVDAHQPVDGLTLHDGPALHLQADRTEEGDRGLEVVDDDEDVVHPHGHVSTRLTYLRHGETKSCPPALTS